MTKAEFNAILREKLSGLPKEDIEKSIEFYNEMIDERTDDGLEEQEAVAAIGTVDEIVSDILADTSLPRLLKEKISLHRRHRIWEIILLIIGAPLWLPILITIAAVVLSVYIVLWTVVAVFYAVTLSFAVGALAGVAVFVLFFIHGNILPGIFFAAAGLVCAGLAVLAFFLSNKTAKGVVILGKNVLLGIKRSFVGKE